MWNSIGPTPPQTMEGGTPQGLHNANQAERHFSLFAHPSDPDIVLVGGARLNPLRVSSRVVAIVDVRLTLGGSSEVTRTRPRSGHQLSPWEPVVCGYANGTAPHADSRGMIWDDVDDSIIQVDDGGIFKLQAPDDYTVDQTTAVGMNFAGDRAWKSLNGDLRVTEATTVAYDSLRSVVFAGTQDNGTVQQTVASPSDGMPDTNGRWETVHVGDGVKVDGGRAKASSVIFGEYDVFVRYFQNNSFNSFSTREYDETNNVDSSKDVPLTASNPTRHSGLVAIDTPASDGGFPSSTANATNPRKLLLGKNGLYESDPAGGNDGGDIVDIYVPHRAPAICAVASNPASQWKPLVYGGFELDPATGSPLPHADVIYAGFNGDIYVRPAGRVFFTSGFLPALGDPGPAQPFIAGSLGNIRDIVLDPTNWRQAFAPTRMNASVTILQTVDGGLTWIPITGALGGQFYALEYIPAASPAISGCGPTDSPGPTCYSLAAQRECCERSIPIRRRPSGSTSAGLPNMVVYDLEYDACDDLLLAGTSGRGIWAASQRRRGDRGHRTDDHGRFHGGRRDRAWPRRCKRVVAEHHHQWGGPRPGPAGDHLLDPCQRIGWQRHPGA